MNAMILKTVRIVYVLAWGGLAGKSVEVSRQKLLDIYIDS